MSDDIATLTADAQGAPAEALGYDPEELTLLQEAGILREEPSTTAAAAAGPWRPTTLADVDWLCWRMKELQAEAEALERQIEKRVDRLNAQRKAILERYGADCEELTRAHLPRRKDGSPARKSLDLDRVRVALRTVPARWVVTDEVALLAEIKNRWTSDALPDRLDDAVQVTERRVLTGPPAVARLFTEGERQVKILLTPLRQYLETTPPVPDPETGEALPATLPGVAMVRAREEWSFE